MSDKIDVALEYYNDEINRNMKLLRAGLTADPNNAGIVLHIADKLKNYRHAIHVLKMAKENDASEPVRCILGVGNGSGDLFVEGSYKAVKKVQEMIFELEQLRSKKDV